MMKCKMLSAVLGLFHCKYSNVFNILSILLRVSTISVCPASYHSIKALKKRGGLGFVIVTEAGSWDTSSPLPRAEEILHESIAS